LLRGGELTFWFQPFYRWMPAPAPVFGDSSMGEFWWDAICLMVFALFAHPWRPPTDSVGLAAAVLCLTIAVQARPMFSVSDCPTSRRPVSFTLPP
jgi:hypothetical protein